MDRRHALQVGFAFGTTSGVITTLGLIVGLAAGTDSRLAVAGGIAMIAIADALSDSLGIHISEEAENVHSRGEIWLATASTFVAKLVVASSFLVPVLWLDLGAAVVASVVWGVAILVATSVRLARVQGLPAWSVAAEHLVVATLVVATTHALGRWLSTALG